jgi:hypothetical protein
MFGLIAVLLGALALLRSRRRGDRISIKQI